MQYDKHYEGLTEAFKAITLPQPLADELATGAVDHFVRPRSTPYRGEILLVSSPKGERGGMMVGRAILDSVSKVAGGYLYRLSNPERIIEFPCQKCGAKSEVWDCFYTAGVVQAYPKISLRRWMGE